MPVTPGMDTEVIVVGGGLAGLHAARLLRQADIDFKLLEARQRFGGRIFSVDANRSLSPDGYDLGPSWLWPEMQPGLAELLGDLDLPAFPQYGSGDVLVDSSPSRRPQRYPGIAQVPESMRLVGGMGSLVAALATDLPTARISLGNRVVRMELLDKGVRVHIRQSGGRNVSLIARYVIAAVPPRLLLSNIEFEPGIDPDSARLWRATATWMAPHAKFFALYQRPFWRDSGLSGSVRSMVGPLAEIHDATTASGAAALFGFVGLDWNQRSELGEAALVAACVEQLGRVFGPMALKVEATLFKDWTDDALTATPDDRIETGHPVPHAGPWVAGPWRSHLALAGSETSSTDPGYLAGAISAARRAVSDAIGWREAKHPGE